MDNQNEQYQQNQDQTQMPQEQYQEVQYQQQQYQEGQYQEYQDFAQQQQQINPNLIYAKNLKETKKIAKRFAHSLNGGEVVLLLGEMGSGKTTFTREVIRNLGFKGIVNSPTFTIMQEYHVKKFGILHYDLYRLENPEESYNFGIEENIKNRDINTILFVEWPERITKFLKGDFVVVQIAKTGEESRSFSITYEKI